MMVSLDGFFEGPDHDLSWHNVDEEFNDYAIAQTKSIDTLLFGRRTYELMAEYWPSEDARKTDPIVADLMNNTPKVVFSKTLHNVQETNYWKNVRLIHDNIAEEVKKLKEQPGKDLAVYGSNNFAVSLIQIGLLDEIRVMINPVVIGKGTPLFAGIQNKLSLKCINTKAFHNGNVLLYYQPINTPSK